MLHDCSSQTDMAECPKCHEVFGKTQLESHMKGSRCTGKTVKHYCLLLHMLTAPPDDHVKCPLCHTNVQNNDEVRPIHVYVHVLHASIFHHYFVQYRAGIIT